MEMSKLLIWAQELKRDVREKKTTFNPIYLSKIEAYADMMIARIEIMTTNAIKGQTYMEEIEAGLEKLNKYGVKTPNQPKQDKIAENPLRP